MIIKKAKPEEAKTLTEIAFKSKAYWGYDIQFMESCKDELTITTDLIQEQICYLANKNNDISGFYILNHISDTIIELEQFFIDPEFIRQGIGKTLFNHAVALAKNKGYKEMEIQADPHAQKFYEKMGAKLLGFTMSQSIKGRKLPQMSYCIE